MLNTQPLLAASFGCANLVMPSQTQEDDPDGIKPEILAQLDESQQQQLRYFVRGLEQEDISSVMTLLGVKNKIELLHMCYGDPDPKKEQAFAARYKLTDAEKKLLHEILKGSDINSPDRDWLGQNPGVILVEISKKIDVWSWSDLFSAVHTQEAPKPRDLLNDREKQIYDLRVQGFSKEEIAGQLLIKESTVGDYLKVIHKKLDVNTLEQLCFAHYGPLDCKQLAFLGSEAFAKSNKGDKLTPREIEIIDLVLQGFDKSETGRLLGLSKHTIADYQKTISRKLNIRHDLQHVKVAPFIFAKVHELAKQWAHWKPLELVQLANHPVAEVDNAAPSAP
jgi:DNA-binding CsgD family transcriptional regulator